MKSRLLTTAMAVAFSFMPDHTQAKTFDSITVPESKAQVFSYENGLTLIVEEDRSAPVASVQAWCGTGSIHEGEKMGAGLSHILEHMLFKGTEKRPPGEIAKQVQNHGGYINAYTSFDRTVYWIDVPTGHGLL
jgi:zinc protease